MGKKEKNLVPAVAEMTQEPSYEMEPTSRKRGVAVRERHQMTPSSTRRVDLILSPDGDHVKMTVGDFTMDYTV